MWLLVQALYATIIVDGEVRGTFRQAWHDGEAEKLRQLATAYAAVTNSLGRQLVKTSGGIERDPDAELRRIYAGVRDVFAGTAVMTWMESTLAPAAEASEGARSPKSPSGKNKRATTTRNLCLLLDDLLEALPMECLPVFQSSKDDLETGETLVLTRDFSLHTLVERLRRLAGAASTISADLRVVVDPKEESDAVVEVRA